MGVAHRPTVTRSPDVQPTLTDASDVEQPSTVLNGPCSCGADDRHRGGRPDPGQRVELGRRPCSGRPVCPASPQSGRSRACQVAEEPTSVGIGWPTSGTASQVPVGEGAARFARSARRLRGHHRRRSTASTTKLPAGKVTTPGAAPRPATCTVTDPVVALRPRSARSPTPRRLQRCWRCRPDRLTTQTDRVTRAGRPPHPPRPPPTTAATTTVATTARSQPGDGEASRTSERPHSKSDSVDPDGSARPARRRAPLGDIAPDLLLGRAGVVPAVDHALPVVPAPGRAGTSTLGRRAALRHRTTPR